HLVFAICKNVPVDLHRGAVRAMERQPSRIDRRPASTWEAILWGVDRVASSLALEIRYIEVYRKLPANWIPIITNKKVTWSKNVERILIERQVFRNSPIDLHWKLGQWQPRGNNFRMTS